MTDDKDKIENLVSPGHGSSRSKEVPERYYNREERLAMMPEAFIKLKSKKKGFFRNNKSMAIILADIIIICLLGVGYLFYTKISTNTTVAGGYSFLLRGYVFDNRALITLTIRKTEPSAAGNDKIPFEAAITLSDNKEFYKKFYDNMPDRDRKEVAVRASIPVDSYYSSKAVIVQAVVKYENSTVKLKYNLKKEK